MKKPFIKEISSSLLRQTGVTIIGLITSVIIARVWGPEGAGWFLICHFLSNIAFTITAAGFPAAITYSLSSKSHGYEELLAWSLLRMPFVLLIQWLFIAIYIIGFADLNIKNIYVIVGMMILIATLNTMKEFILSILQSKKEVIRYNKCLAIESLSVLAFLTIFSILKLPMLISIFSSLILASTLGFLPTAINILKKIKWPKQVRKSQRDTIAFAMKSYPSVLLAFLNNRFSIIFITVFFNIEALGIFSVALTLSEKLLALARAVSISIFPRVAEKSSNANFHTPLLTSLSFWITGVIAIVLAAIAKPLITLLYGTNFNQAISFVYLLISAIPFFAVSRILAQDLAGRGRPELNSITSAAALVVNITLCFVLYEEYQLLAVVISFVGSMLTNTIFKIVIWCKLTKQPFTSVFLLNTALIKSYLS